MGVANMEVWIGLMFIGMLFSCCCGDDQNPMYLCMSTRTLHSGFNVAHLSVNSKGLDVPIIVQLVTTECHTCPLQNATYIPAKEMNCTVIVDTRWPIQMAITSNDTGVQFDHNCTDGSLIFHFMARGNYNFFLTMKDNVISCRAPVIQNSPSDDNIPVYAMFGIFAGLALLWVAVKRGRRSFLTMISSITPVVDEEFAAEQDLGTPTNVMLGHEKSMKKERLKSLDTFRGISLVIMMFVNYGGGNYWYFNHSIWNGLTVADLVFPWFIWIMGTALAYSFQSLSRSNVSRFSIYLKIVRRSLTLFALGILVNSGGSDNFKNWRVMGVLQRFALTYFVTATLQLVTMQNIDSKLQHKWGALLDIVLYWKEWIVQLSLVVIHLCITFLLKVPGCPTGYLGAGGLATDGPAGSNVSLCTGGAAGYIDRLVLGHKLVYGGPTCKSIYNTSVHYDPEGLLGTLNSCFLCFLGLQAGKILTIYRNPRSRIVRFLIWSVVTGVLAAILCKARKNDGWIPVNKNLWSLSYILAMASMAFILLTFCYVVIDELKLWSGAPFYYPGMNSIVVYVSHEVFSQPWQTFWDITPYTHATQMLMNIWDVTFWVLMSMFLYFHRIFIAV